MLKILQMFTKNQVKMLYVSITYSHVAIATKIFNYICNLFFIPTFL